MMKNIVILVVMLVLLVQLSVPAGAGSVDRAVSKIRQALLLKDYKVLNQQVALESIVKAKLHKFSGLLKVKRSLMVRTAGRVMQMSEPVTAKIITNYILSQYNNSSLDQRSEFLNTFLPQKISELEQVAYVSGNFMGAGITIAAANLDGEWVVVGVESPLIDNEFKNLLKSL